MAHIHVKNIVPGNTIGAGQTHFVRWNNSLNSTVYDFSLIAHAHPGTNYSGWVRAEMSPIRYGRKPENNSRFVEFFVTNLSSHAITYQVFMSWAHN